MNQNSAAHSHLFNAETPDETGDDKPDDKHDGAVRFSVSLPAELARDLDAMVVEKGCANRSQALADMIRAQLVEHRQELDGQIAGTITLLFDHHKPRLQSLLTDVQHDHAGLIVSTLHVHLDHDNCLEVLVVRGDATQIRALADALIAAKGVKHGRLIVTATSQDLPFPPLSAAPHSHE